jgi:hypothetical protein
MLTEETSFMAVRVRDWIGTWRLKKTAAHVSHNEVGINQWSVALKQDPAVSFRVLVEGIMQV